MKVRIRKPLEGGKHLKKGVITVEDERGTTYRFDCEGCGLTLKLAKHPVEGDQNLCKDCRRVGDIGKPDTRIMRNRKSFDYETPCDSCGALERTSFLPKRDRAFLCNDCMKEERLKTRQAELVDDQERQPEPVEETRQPESPQARSAGEPIPVSHPNATVRDSQDHGSSDREPEALDRQPEKIVEREAHQRKTTYEVSCSKCRKKMELKFKPSGKKPFICPSCYEARQQEMRGEKPDTKILYNIECTRCGKQETLNFVPTFPDRALCSSCFEAMKRRKK